MGLSAPNLLVRLRLLDAVCPVLLPSLSLFDSVHTLLLASLRLLAIDMLRLMFRDPLFTLHVNRALSRPFLSLLRALGPLLTWLGLLPHGHAPTALLGCATRASVAAAIDPRNLAAIMSATVARLCRRRGRDCERSNACRKK